MTRQTTPEQRTYLLSIATTSKVILGAERRFIKALLDDFEAAEAEVTILRKALTTEVIHVRSDPTGVGFFTLQWLCLKSTMISRFFRQIGILPKKSQRQTCKVCGRFDKFDFHVPDLIWEAVIPALYRNRVVCLSCFDDFAYQRQVDYAKYITILYFAGDQAAFEFRKVRSA